MARRERFRIAHVTPYPWGAHHEVNDFVARTAAGLHDHRHEVVVLAPAVTRRAVRDSRRAIRAAGEDHGQALFGAGWEGERAIEDGPPLLAIGQGIPLPRGPKPRPAPLPLDASRSLEALMNAVDFDIVHVHDPFAPSVSSAALRHSRALNVGSFHEPTERILSTQVARPLVEIFFGRLDARTATGPATADLMERFFPGGYEIVAPGGEVGEGAWPGAGAGIAAGKRAVRIAYCAREERGALRLFLRALRRLPLELAWEAAIWSDDPQTMPRLSRALAERVAVVGPSDADGLLAAADIVCATSGGPRPAPGLIRQAFAAGAVPVAAQIPAYQELLAAGQSGSEAGFLFPAGDAITLAGQVERLLSNAGLRKRMAAAGKRSARPWKDTVGETEAIYQRLIARRHDPAGNRAVAKRIASRPMIDIDLHMHTDHSNDCATPVEVLLETARDRGLGAIAVTDHNEISGALAARDAAERIGIKVIVGEEVKTAEQGEVIGLFLSEKIERGMTMAETIAEIRRQGGLVYVPHPFDRLHSVPDYEHLLGMVEEIDIIEVFNPRVAYSGFNEEAERFASKYRLIPGAGSDGHVAQALGSVRIRVHDFGGAEEFLEAMRDADIVRKHKNLVYVQALKWMQSPQAGARKDVRNPPPVKGGQRRTRAGGRARRRSNGVAGRGKS